MQVLPYLAEHAIHKTISCSNKYSFPYYSWVICIYTPLPNWRHRYKERIKMKHIFYLAAMHSSFRLDAYHTCNWVRVLLSFQVHKASALCRATKVNIRTGLLANLKYIRQPEKSVSNIVSIKELFSLVPTKFITTSWRKAIFF